VDDLNGQKFEMQYSRKGRVLLDRIFGEFTPERERVHLARPRHEHQVVFVVEYNEHEQFQKAVNNLCHWLKKEGDFGQLKNLMLY